MNETITAAPFRCAAVIAPLRRKTDMVDQMGAMMGWGMFGIALLWLLVLAFLILGIAALIKYLRPRPPTQQ
ncbi:MAG: hypothetical protein HY985_02595 [Magnetospirillum sp.]|nr:hypothetical protein [Magnetospirillum sp.]